MALDRLLDAFERLPAFIEVTNALPVPAGALRVNGLAGSSDAVLAATLVRLLPTRFFVIAADTVAEAERWLADLNTLLGDASLALYPPREGFGEAEPHMEVAGERIETLERLTRGDLRLLLTTARALLERTRMPRAIKALRVELRKGGVHRLEELIGHLEAIGFERVPMVEDVAQFSVRGGILDVYSFGMTDPVRAEFWGDEIIDLKHFELASQRSTRAVDMALVLPVDGAVSDEIAGFDRGSIMTLFPPDAIVLVPQGSHLEPELRRTWDDAHHHIELARRRGEDVPPRAELFDMPEATLASLRVFGTIRIADSTDRVDISFPVRPPEPIDRDVRALRKLVRDGMPTVILCDNIGQAERLDELLTEDDRAFPSPAALTVGVLDGGFLIPPHGQRVGLRVLTDHEIFRRERRIRRSRRYAGGYAIDAMSLKVGDYVVHLEHGVGIYRGIETIFVRESTIEVAVIEYEGGDRLNVPLYRIDQIERYRSASDVSDDMPPPRLHRLGGRKWSQQRDKTRSSIQEMTSELLDLYARR